MNRWSWLALACLVTTLHLLIFSWLPPPPGPPVPPRKTPMRVDLVDLVEREPYDSPKSAVVRQVPPDSRVTAPTKPTPEQPLPPAIPPPDTSPSNQAWSPAPSEAPTAAPTPPPEPPYRPLTADLHPPVLPSLKNRIRYPENARRRGWEATVVLDLLIDESGVIRGIEIVQNPGSGFAEAAVAALQGLVAIPAQSQGQPVAVRYRFPVQFSLR